MKTTDNIEKILTPQCEFKASAGLKDRILEAAAQEEVQAVQDAPKVQKMKMDKHLRCSCGCDCNDTCIQTRHDPDVCRI